MADYFAGVDRLRLIKVEREPTGFFRFHRDGWVEDSDLRFVLYGDPDDGPFYKAWGENGLRRISARFRRDGCRRAR
jgi:hypothetical protein